MQAIIYYYKGEADVKLNRVKWTHSIIEIKVFQQKIEYVSYEGHKKYYDNGDLSWEIIIERPIHLGVPKFVKSNAKMLKKNISIRLPSKEVLKGAIIISKTKVDYEKVEIYANGIGELKFYKEGKNG
jgi:hypothetical protein